MNGIGQTARFVRESRGLTQRAAAEALGVSAVHLSNIERGRTQPSAALIARFKDVYGLDVYILCHCMDESEDAPPAVVQARRSLAQAMREQLAGAVEEA
jgi:transcriptional regulator with XRE-family HTH domain